MATHSIGNSVTKTISIEVDEWPKIERRMKALEKLLPVRKLTLSGYYQMLAKADLNSTDGTEKCNPASPVQSALSAVQRELKVSRARRKKDR